MLYRQKGRPKPSIHITRLGQSPQLIEFLARIPYRESDVTETPDFARTALFVPVAGHSRDGRVGAYVYVSRDRNEDPYEDLARMVKNAVAAHVKA